MSLASLLFFFSLFALASGRTTSTSLGFGDASSSNVKLSGGIQKSFVVAIDTTSADLLVVQSGCLNNAGQPCASSAGGFVLAQSRTYIAANCTYVPNCACNSTTNQTQPCSVRTNRLCGLDSETNTCKLSIPSLQLSGIFGVDTLGFGNSSAQVPIGLVTYAPSLWSSATQDGQIGFAYSATSLTGAKSIFRFLGISQLAICFGQTGGTLTLGAPDTTLYSGVPQTVPILQRDVANEYTRFIVPLVFFALNGASVKNASQPLNTEPYTTVIDSTSPSIQLPAPLYAALRAQLNATCYSSSPSYLLCSARGLLVTDLTLVYDKNLDLERLPDIILTFSDINGEIFSLNVPSTHWVRYWPARSTGYDWEAAMAITASADNTIVLGQTFLSTYYTMFDKDANVTSFAPATDSCYYGYSQQPGKVLRVPSLLILLGALGVVALIFGAAVVIILRTRRSNYTIIYG